jgi:hypothetical protein
MIYTGCCKNRIKLNIQELFKLNFDFFLKCLCFCCARVSNTYDAIKNQRIVCAMFTKRKGLFLPIDTTYLTLFIFDRKPLGVYWMMRCTDKNKKGIQSSIIELSHSKSSSIENKGTVPRKSLWVYDNGWKFWSKLRFAYCFTILKSSV